MNKNKKKKLSEEYKNIRKNLKGITNNILKRETIESKIPIFGITTDKPKTNITIEKQFLCEHSKDIEEIYQKGFTRVREIKVKNSNDKCHKKYKTIAKDIGKALVENKILLHIDLTNVINTIDDIKAIANGLQNNDRLRILSLKNNNLNQYENKKISGTSLIFDALFNNKNSALEYLDISGYEICLECVQSIAKVLANNSTLTKLFMNGNNIGDKGMQIIAEALQNNSTLSVLSIMNNNIGDYTANALLLALVKKPNRKNTLNIIIKGNNNITDSCKQNILKQLRVYNYDSPIPQYMVFDYEEPFDEQYNEEKKPIGVVYDLGQSNNTNSLYEGEELSVGNNSQYDLGAADPLENAKPLPTVHEYDLGAAEK